MKIVSAITCFFLCILITSPLQSQEKSRAFPHGVASGDPLPDGVVIWTRINSKAEVVDVEWELARDIAFENVLFSGKVITGPERDYTVKIDVSGLFPDQFYFYRFRGEGGESIIGRTRTAPGEGVEKMRLAIVSCANYEGGFFNAYGRIADRKDINAVVHLGDYIYEYGPGVYGDTTLGRKHRPAKELVTLEDYRTRYAQYRMDRALREVHRQHPFIMTWDDHEIANNAHSTGAQNHQSDKEGEYSERKSAAQQAYLEWMPLREQPNSQIYRSLKFGNLAELIMLDERLAGRSTPVKSINEPGYKDGTRSMLGEEQYQWFCNQLEGCGAAWKIIGNQVLFSDLNLKEFTPNRPFNLDAWDGYPVEKKRVMNFFNKMGISNLIFVTGDTHASWAFEVPKSMSKYRADKSGVVAVEFGTTSISSPNYDERYPVDTVRAIEKQFMGSGVNPHLKYVNLRDHGYLLLTLTPLAAKAEWWYVDTIKRPSKNEHLGKVFIVRKDHCELKTLPGKRPPIGERRRE